jgi:phosphate transport system substrate-binding protein
VSYSILLRPAALAVFALLALYSVAEAAEQISIRGSQVGAEPVMAAAWQAKKELDVEFKVVTEGGNAGAIAAVGADIADVAVTSRKTTPQENATWATQAFVQSQMGMQAVLVVVPDQVWNAGVRALTQEQIRGIYEGTITNWKDVGGDDRKIVLYNRDVSGSVWELLMVFLYDDTRKAPMSTAEVIKDAADVATSVEFNSGSISILEFSAFKGGRLHALGIRTADGAIIEPTLENVIAGRYPMCRPLMMITARKPTGTLRRFIEFMLGPTGQEFVKKTGHIPIAELTKKTGR